MGDSPTKTIQMPAAEVRPGDVVAGKYRITISQLDPYPGVDKLKGAYSRQKSPIVRDLTGEPVEIDLAKPEG